MPEADSLSTYRAKRDFAKTAEPKGQVERRAGNRFIVQKHDATRLHFDFRLELDGVLKSWAVTRGPSLDPDDKRLAVRTEDHPLSYADFEGTIPKGQYGGGTVMLWDRGIWQPTPGKDPSKTLQQGHLHFTLHGERMKGEWLLIRMAKRPGEKRENWLLRKLDDAYVGNADDLVSAELTSVATGRTMAAIAAGRKAPQRGAVRKGHKKPLAKLPPFQPVALATLVDHVPAGDGWLHEMKYDGYRGLLAVAGGEVRIYTRSGLDWSDRFPAIVEAASALDLPPALIDGEIVVLDDEGRPSFQQLQQAIKAGSADAVMFAFDLPVHDGKDMRKQPLTARKEALKHILPADHQRIRFSEHIRGNGEKLFSALCEAGLEGVVSKRAASFYVGARTTDWLKTKCTRRQEFVIAGWTPSGKTRGFRSLLLAQHDANGKLHYAGKVGTGFNANEMDMLARRLKALERKSATVDAPSASASARNAHWVTPRLVAEVAYSEVTADGVLRHPSYLGLREDKPEEDVMPEKAQRTEAVAGPIAITNPGRLIFPEAKITKGDLAAYYNRIVPLILAWMANRPISLVRCPQGRAKKCFFQKHDAGSFGDAVRHVSIREKDGNEEPYLYVTETAGLAACVQMGTIEFHGWGARVDDVERPDRLVFDLDPDEGLGFDAVIDAAFHVRKQLEGMGLQTFPMVTGGKGIHVIAPLIREAAWPEVKSFAERFARALSQARPDQFTATMSKAQRKGRIFMDWLRNQRGATAIMPYSARARPNAPVAVPVSWQELRAMENAAEWQIGRAEEMLDHARSKALAGWGLADQTLPSL